MIHLGTKKIIVMKKYFIFLVCCFVFSISYGQAPKKIEGKPDYAETVKFIKANLNNALFNEGIVYQSKVRKDGNYVMEESFRNLTMEFDLCYLDVSYAYTRDQIFVSSANRYNSDKKIENATILFSKIESILVLVDDDTGHVTSENEPVSFVSLFFKKYGENEPIKIHVPLGLYARSENMQEKIKNSQIYKAFDHLRKLCGAPEPITF